MPHDYRTTHFYAYQDKRQAIMREYEAALTALWDTYQCALRDAQDEYTAAMTPQKAE